MLTAYQKDIGFLTTHQLTYIIN